MFGFDRILAEIDYERRVYTTMKLDELGRVLARYAWISTHSYA
jgi:hypothetical protein